MCPPPAYTASLPAHRPLSPVYSIDRIRATRAGDREALGRLVHLLSPLVEQQLAVHGRNGSLARAPHLRAFKPEDAVADLQSRLFLHFHDDAFRHLRRYNETLIPPDFRPEAKGHDRRSGFDVFCSLIDEPPFPEARFVAEHLSDQARDLCRDFGRPLPQSSALPQHLADTLCRVVKRWLERDDLHTADHAEPAPETNWDRLRALFPRVFKPKQPDDERFGDAVAEDVLAVQLLALGGTTRTFFFDTLTVDERRTLLGLLEHPDIRRRVTLHVVCRDIECMIHNGLLQHAAPFEPHLHANTYIAGLLAHLNTTTDPTIAAGLRLHLDRSLFEAAFHTEVIDSKHKFERWARTELKYLALTLRNTDLSDRRRRAQRPVDDDDYLTVEALTVPEPSPFEKASYLIDTLINDPIQRQVLRLKYLQEKTDHEIVAHFREHLPEAGPWHRKRIIAIKKRALLRIGAVKSDEEGPFNPRVLAKHYATPIPVLAIDCVAQGGDACFLLSGYNAGGSPVVLPPVICTSADALFDALHAKGLHGVQLLVSDFLPGLPSALQRAFPDAAWQYCLDHLAARLHGNRDGRAACRALRGADTLDEARHHLTTMQCARLNASPASPDHDAALTPEALQHALTFFTLYIPESHDPTTLRPLSIRERGHFISTPHAADIAGLAKPHHADRAPLSERIRRFLQLTSLRNSTAYRITLPVTDVRRPR